MRSNFLFLFAVAFCVFTLNFAWIENAGAEEISRILEAGQQAYKEGKYEEAERIFGDAVHQEADNYKALHGLAETKIKLKKYLEAEDLLDRILKMPLAKGRNIFVTLPGETESQPAELVDETVMRIDEEERDKQQAQPVDQFIKQPPLEPVPHYRVYLMQSGKMKVVPKSKTRISYKGIPTATRELVMSLKDQVKKLSISTLGGKTEEEMVTVEGGCFQMGSNSGDPDEKPVHEVCLSSFQMSKYEVRQKNFQAVMNSNPSQNVGADLPVESVTWDEAQDYCKKQGLRLPTEAEWEYAARAGSTTPFYWGSTVRGQEGNFCDHECQLNIREPRVSDGFVHTAPVGSFAPNPWGLHDMAGNVSEWVQDWWDMEKNYYMMGPRQDPPGPHAELDACMRVDCIGSLSITLKIYRGGAWNQRVAEMRSASRLSSHFQLRLEGTGFRCAAGKGK